MLRLPPSERRKFLKQSAQSIVGASLLADARGDAFSDQIAPSSLSSSQIPPQRQLDLPGLHSYAERSVTAGETIHFRTSSSVPYQLSIFQLAGDVDDRKTDVLLHQFDPSPALCQPIHPGSYVHIENGLTDEPLQALSLECWVRPWHLKGWQGLITQHDFPDACGIGLFINPEGRATFFLGNGEVFDESRNVSGAKLNHRRWNHITGTWDGTRAAVWVNGRKSAECELTGPVRPGRSSLRLGAYGQSGKSHRFLEGDLSMPTIYGGPLSPHQIQERIDARGLKPPQPNDVIACWPLSEEQGSTVTDIGPEQRQGTIINHATWMVGGPSFHGDQVGRHDEAYVPSQDEDRGHALRFAGDDLFDCRWDVTHAFTVPADAKSGLFVGRFDYTYENHDYEYYVTFNVRRPATRPKPSILVLLSSSTWTAYNSSAFPAPASGRQSVGTGGLPSSHPEAPSYSCYRDHHHGQPAYYFGRNIPWPAASPEWRYLRSKMQYSHLTRGEMFLHRWLDGHYGDHHGYEYDVVTDYDLHCNPEMLRGYKTLFINGHSEYWSAEAYRGVDQFLAAGGSVIALSGNTMFWRTSFSEDGTVMECRKYDNRIGGRGGATIGELYHSHDQQRGSLMRECGLPAWKCIGLECCGWGGDTNGAYHTELPEHFLFNEPESAELVKYETFGHARGEDYPMSIGHEWDVRLSTIHKMTHVIPEGATLPKEPEGITTLAKGIRRGGGTTLDYFTAQKPVIDNVCAELIYWERPTGGRVFHAGAIAAGSTLSVDPKWQTVMRNVLHHFGVGKTA